MNEPPDAEREPDGYIRLPWPVVGGGLFVLLAALLAFGLFANRNLRPQLTVAPTAVIVGEAPTPGLIEAATPTALVGALATQVGTATAQPAPVAAATVAATATPAPVPVLATASATAAATPEPAATPRPTVSPELAAEVGDAYKQYWQIRAEALYDLDDSRLTDVMAGDHLAAAEELIARLRSEHRGILTDVHHRYVVLDATQDAAEVMDTYVDQSVYVDAQTHVPVSSPTGQTLNELYGFTKTDGTWRVVTLVRDE